MAEFYTVLTDVGANKLAAATAGQRGPVVPASVRVGDGGGGDFYDNFDRPALRALTAIPGEQFSTDVNNLRTDDQNPNWIIVEGIIPANEGGYVIRVAGVTDTEGDLIAVARFPETYKPVLADGASQDMVIRTIMEVTDATSVDLSIDPSAVLATEAFVLEQRRAFVRKPAVLAPTPGEANVVTTVTVEGTSFAPLYSVDARDYRQFQVKESTAGWDTTIVDAQVNADDYEVTLSTDTQYNVRIRDVDVNGEVSEWSDVITFTTADTFIDEPTVSVSGSPDNITRQPTISTSAFSVTNGSDTHQSTDWEVVETGTSTVVFESNNDSSNLTTIVFPAGTLDVDTEYQFRARHRGDTFGVSAYGEVTETTAATFVSQPNITEPPQGATDIGETPTFESTAFSVTDGTDTHAASQWRIVRTSDNSVVDDTGEDTINLEAYTISAGILDEGEIEYEVEVRHKGDTFGFSDWSPVSVFTTASAFFDPADPSNVGGEFAGGFLVGVIDTVQGTIDSADDYQTGERYALVVAPKEYEGGRDSSPAAGLPTGDLEWDTQDRGGESGAITRWNGLEATNTILAKNDSSYEAFEFIRSLRQNYPAPAVDGGSDWYLPALDELELIYRNLKPVTADNYISTQTETFPGSQDNGFNPSSDPQGSAYTANDPSQTSATDFQSGGAEAVDLEYYWTSTDTNDSGGQAWYQRFTASGLEGNQYGASKDNTSLSVRPVRRVVL